MTKNLPVLSLLILSLTCYSQQNFKKGYFIDNSDQKIKGEIKVKKWRDNPSEFEYRLSENDEPRKATLNSVKEFGLDDNSAKYIRKAVYIDKSRENFYNHLSKTRAPEFEEEQLFLKVLIEGKASLYLYSDGSLQRFFYKKEAPEIKQLVFKKYKTPEGNTLENNEFRQQLWNDLKCSSIEMTRIHNLKYRKTSIAGLFIDYNNCDGSDFIRYKEQKKRSLFHLAVRPRANHSSLSIEHTRMESRNAEFGNKIGLGLGIELESGLPFNTRNWTVFVEPAFQYFESEKATETKTVNGGIQVVKINYKSIEMPIGLKRYFFFNQNSKLFLSASFVVDYSFNSLIDYTRSDGDVYNSLDLELALNPAVGMGFQYEHYSLGARYHFSRNILQHYLHYNSDYSTTSIILGYTLF